MAEGEFALGKQHLEEALKQTGEWIGDHDLYALLVDGAVEQPDEAALRHYAPLAEATAARYGHELYQAITQRAWGVLYRLTEDYDEAETRLQRALKLFSAMDTRWQMGRTLRELGVAAQAQQRIAEARDYFARAIALFDAMGAAPDFKRARELLATLS